MQVLLFLHRLYFFVILNIRNKKTYKMKKIIFLFIISSLISIKGIGLTLSPETEVSILTCAPGNELYSLFGHTAIRINDPRHQIDRVYNYGTFDFSTPHFYLKICTRPASLSADCSEILPFHIQLSAGRTYGLRSNYPAGFAGKTTDFRSARREPAPAKPLLSLQLSIR